MWLRVVLSNLPFAAALLFSSRLPPLAGVLVVGAILFLVPGLAWTHRRQGDAFVVLYRVVMISLGATVATWLALLVLPGPTSRTGFLLSVAAFTNIGLWFGSAKGAYKKTPFSTSFARAVMCVGVLFFLQSYIGAAYRVPPLEDQDVETQGTAYGLIHAFRPAIITNGRGTTNFFAHPLLLHVWIGLSALITNDLDRLKYYYDAAVEMSGHTQAEMDARFDRDYEKFLRDPLLIQTRTPNLFLGVFTLFALAFTVRRLSGSSAAAIGACAIYATLPEVYVRSAYGGYMPLTNFAMTSAAYFYLQYGGLFPRTDASTDDDRATDPWDLSMAGFVAAWSDQKSILVPLAAGSHVALRIVVDGLLSLGRRMIAIPAVWAAATVCAGFVAGWATYALYGLSVARDDFIADHVYGHLINRMRLQDVNLARGGMEYPSILGLWHEFAVHTGWLIVLPGLVALMRAARKIRDAEGFFLLWVLIAVVGFSVTDWRQTKHLAHLLPALIALTALLWASSTARLQLLLTVVLTAGVTWNIWRVAQLMYDFNYIQPRPMW